MRRSRRGVSTIEFAMSLPIVLLMLAMIADGCLAMLHKHALSRAVRDGARVASSVTERIPATGDDIESAAILYTQASLETSGFTTGDVVVTSTWDTSAALARIEVVGGLRYRPLMGRWSPFKQVIVQEFSMITVEQP